MMSFDPIFSDELSNVLAALRRANKRTLTLAETYGMDARLARLIAQVYNGALDDLGLALGQGQAEPGTVLAIPAHILEKR